MRIVVILLLLLFWQQQADAQQSRQYTFKNFSVNNGLASNVVSRVMQDRDGYVWIATSNGLQRYDGNKFLTFRNEPGNPKTIPGNVVSKVYVDKRIKIKET